MQVYLEAGQEVSEVAWLVHLHGGGEVLYGALPRQGEALGTGESGGEEGGTLAWLSCQMVDRRREPTGPVSSGCYHRVAARPGQGARRERGCTLYTVEYCEVLVAFRYRNVDISVFPYLKATTT